MLTQVEATSPRTNLERRLQDDLEHLERRPRDDGGRQRRLEFLECSLQRRLVLSNVVWMKRRCLEE